MPRPPLHIRALCPECGTIRRFEYMGEAHGKLIYECLRCGRQILVSPT